MVDVKTDFSLLIAFTLARLWEQFSLYDSF